MKAGMGMGGDGDPGQAAGLGRRRGDQERRSAFHRYRDPLSHAIAEIRFS
jgi:hypothetical protein